jgi:hypothetical protein
MALYAEKRIMKAQLESPELAARGVELTSETTEEKMVLEEIWNTAGGAAVFSREKDGSIKLVVCPHIKRESNWPICQARFIRTGERCNKPAKYRIRAIGSPGVVCGLHARAFTKDARIPLTTRTGV